MIEVENTDVNIVRNLIPMRNHMPASAYGLKAISDWFPLISELLPTMSFGGLSDTELIIWTKDFKKPNKNCTEVCMAGKKLLKGGNFVLRMEMAI